MNDEDLTSILLSGAAADIEAVQEIRDDLSAEETAALAEVVARLKDLHERLAYRSTLRDVQTRAWAVSEMETVLDDSRYHYDSANVEVNPSLAFIQADFSTRVRYLGDMSGFTYGEDYPEQGELDYPDEEWSGWDDEDADPEAVEA